MWCWILFDSASTTHLASNENLVNNIQNSGETPGVLGTGGEIQVTKEAAMNSISDVPFTPDGLANFISMAHWSMQGSEF